ncbi:CHASE3 domain-containing protein [Paenibacillus sp. CC-CFT747]|nr:CHASE3 domain-containing protein [Paenibacillus sp. CC-CFT747]
MSYPRVKGSVLNIAAVALLLLVSLISYAAFTNMEKETDRIMLDTIPVTNAVQSLLTDVLNEETGVRAYVARNNRSFLDPYYLGQISLNRNVEYLTNNADRISPNLGPILERKLVPSLEVLKRYFEDQIALVDSGKIEDARGRINAGKTDMDQFRSIHNELLLLIGEDTRSAGSQMKKAADQTRLIVMVSGLLAIAVGVVSIIVFGRAGRAEAALRVSEEKYRLTAETLEAHNEEILAQQEEQEVTLLKLTEREQELEWITSYQEKLTGFMQLEPFLRGTVPALLEALELDAALVLLREPEENGFRVVYSIGYPSNAYPRLERELYGSAGRALETREPLRVRRALTESEKGLHASFEHAADWYVPLLDDKQEMIGFLLLTLYGAGELQDAQKERLLWGLTRQFGLAFFAQLVNEERHKQSERLKELNAELGNEKELIRGIVESSHEGILMAGLDGTALVANSRIGDYFGWENTLGTGMLRLFRQLEQGAGTPLSLVEPVKEFLAGETESVSLRFPFRRAEGLRYLELYATPVRGRDGGVRGYLFVFRDRSEEERVDEMKNEFISIVSHELRTPLASVLGFVEILLNREVAPDKRKRYLQTIYDEANRLSTLINDFLDLQRMESGQQVYHYEPVEWNALVREVAEQWKGRPTHEIRLHVPGDSLVVRGTPTGFASCCIMSSATP